MIQNFLIISFLLLLCGCQASWEMVGVTSTKTFNKGMGEVEDLAKDVIKNQSRIVEISKDMNSEIIYLAKARDDTSMLERAYTTAGKIMHAKEVSEELSTREFSKAPDPPFDWSGLLSMALGAMGVGGPIGMLAMGARSKLKAVAQEAIRNGESTEKNDTSHLKKYQS